MPRPSSRFLYRIQMLGIAVVTFVLKLALAALIFYTYYFVCLTVGTSIQYGNYKPLFFIFMMTVFGVIFYQYRRTASDRAAEAEEPALEDVSKPC